MRPQRIVVALPLEEELLAPLHEWGRKFDFSHVESVHFLHVVKKNITPLEFGLIETPDEETYHDMMPALEKFLREESKKILPPGFQGETSFQLTKDFHPEEEVIDILKNRNATLIVVATRGKHGFEGLFHSSFTDYMVKFAPCDVFVVRPGPKAEAKPLKKSA
ncbi:universal stress protein [Peredibacter sp. HCB2-198]|uniref:universal stress protein n=1 Tax=Peredibacter sp. HCB2-198 TaxID=3383025 RepID=UPI0038B47F45